MWFLVFSVCIAICLPTIICTIVYVVLLSRLHQMSLAPMNTPRTSEKTLQLEFCDLKNISVETRSEIKKFLCERCCFASCIFSKTMRANTYILYALWNGSVNGCILVREQHKEWYLSVLFAGGVCRKTRLAQQMLTRVRAVGIDCSIKYLKIYLSAGKERPIHCITDEIQFYRKNKYVITNTHYCDDTHIFTTHMERAL